MAQNSKKMNTKQKIIVALVIIAGTTGLIILNEIKEKSANTTEHLSVQVDMTADNQKFKIPTIDWETKLRKNQPIEVSFQGVSAEGDNFFQTFTTEHICDSLDSKESRRKWWKRTGKKAWEVIQETFLAWVDSHHPYRSYAIAIDITDGWDGKFTLSEYLSPEEINWIENNKFDLTIYSIGFNEIPGKRQFSSGESQQFIETTVKKFLSEAPETMPETKLFQQMQRIFSYNYYKIIIKTDLMHHEKNFSAYNYKAGQEVNLAPYFTSRSIFPRKVEVLVQIPVTGRTSVRQAWYDEVENQLILLFPETEFQLK